jgi:hypothetical protein
MTDFTNVEIGNGLRIVVGGVRIRRNEPVEAERVRDLSARAVQTVASTLDPVRDAAHEARTRLVAMPHEPDEIGLVSPADCRGDRVESLGRFDGGPVPPESAVGVRARSRAHTVLSQAMPLSRIRPLAKPCRDGPGDGQRRVP